MDMILSAINVKTQTQAQLSMSIQTQALKLSMPNQWTQSYQLSMSNIGIAVFITYILEF